MSKNNKRITEFTKLSWSLGLLAVICEIGIALLYLYDTDASVRYFVIMTFIEGFSGVLGLLFIDVIYGKSFQFRPKYFKESDSKSFFHVIIIFGCLTLAQIIAWFPITVREIHLASAIIFAGIVEELFFRGFLMAIFIKLGEDDRKYHIFKKPGKKEYFIVISNIEIIGIILSSLLFMFFHVNYYGNTSLLLTVFMSGFFLALFYQMYRDLTANMIAHLLINILIVYKSFYLVSF